MSLVIGGLPSGCARTTQPYRTIPMTTSPGTSSAAALGPTTNEKSRAGIGFRLRKSMAEA